MRQWRLTVGGVPMLRPEWWELNREVRGVVLCRCGSALWDQESTHTHWQMGHFDSPDSSASPATTSSPQQTPRLVALWETA